MNARVLLIGIGVLALGLIGYGAWRVYPPAGPIAVGALVWVDLNLMRRNSRRQDSGHNPGG